MDLDNDFSDQYFATNYGKMHYKRHEGKGATVILLHGFAASIRSWTRLVGHLPPSLDLYAIDLLGHGMSDSPNIDYSVRMHYETLSDFIRNSVDDIPVMFGHSYGGWLAAYYASLNKCSGLILEDSAGLPEFNEERHKLRPGFRDDLVKRALPLNPKEYVLKSMLHSDNTRVQLDKSTLGKINCKCKIIWGRDDNEVNLKYSELFLGRIKDSTLAVIDAKHTPHYSNPEEVANILTDFI